MFLIEKLLIATATVLDIVLITYMIVVIARAVISWVSPDPYNPIVRFLYNATEPLMYRIRRRLPNLGGIDVSPIVLILGIVFLRIFLVQSLMELAYRLD